VVKFHSWQLLIFCLEENMNKFLLLLRSRKFWAALVGLVMVVVVQFVPDFPFEESQVQEFVWIIVAYITGTALEDGLSRR
jgi:hypothetical protein